MVFNCFYFEKCFEWLWKCLFFSFVVFKVCLMKMNGWVVGNWDDSNWSPHAVGRKEEFNVVCLFLVDWVFSGLFEHKQLAL